MSSPVSVSQDQAAQPVHRRPSITQELPAIPPELSVALERDQVALRREVLLWQRWVRYMALGTLMFLSLALSGAALGPAMVPIFIVGLAYVAAVMTSSWILQRTTGARLHAALPSLLLAADILTITGLCYLTSGPAQLNRVLLLGLLSVQLGVFHFGRGHGTLAACLAAGAYLVATFAVPPFVEGPRPTVLTAAFDTTLFGVTAAVLIHTFGGFRERMDNLRLYCKIVESGQLARIPTMGNERWPDALTLLARSFDAMRRQLADQAGNDALTGCVNRRTLETALTAELRRARRRATAVSVVAIDIDYFKQINDAHGHLTGDLVLQQLAAIMKSTARDTDTVARFGGDEFFIVLSDTDIAGAAIFAERLRTRIDESRFGLPDAPINSTISVGIASVVPGVDGIEGPILMQQADRALYRAKAAGRNRVVS